MDIKDYGISQKLSLNSEVAGVTLQPFAELGYAKGRFSIEASGYISEINDTLNFEARRKYTKTTATLGLQAVLQNGISPYAKIEASSLKFDSDAEFNISTSSSSESSVEAQDELKMTQETLSVGLNILF